MIVIPQSYPVLPRVARNGDRALSKDVLVSGSADIHLAAGRVWAQPPLVSLWVPPFGNAEATFRCPVRVRPGCAGWVWNLKAGLHAETPAPSITLRCLDLLGQEVSFYDSILEPETLGTLRYDTAFSAAARSPIGPDPQGFVTPPTQPTPGVLSIPPTRSFRDLVILVVVQSLVIGALNIYPLVSPQPLATMEE